MKETDNSINSYNIVESQEIVNPNSPQATPVIDEDDEFGDLDLSYIQLKNDGNGEDEEDDEFGDLDLSCVQLKDDGEDEEDDEFGDLNLSTVQTKDSSNGQLAQTETEIVDLDDLNPIKEYNLALPFPEKNESWLVDREKLIDLDEALEKNKDFHIPLVIDTEFKTNNKSNGIGFGINAKLKQSTRQRIVMQVKGVDADAPNLVVVDQSVAELINGARRNVLKNDPFTGKKRRNLQPLPEYSSEFILLDYLRSLGYSSELRQAKGKELELNSLPIALVSFYAFFLLAELNLICNGSLKDEIKEYQRNQTGTRIDMERRVRTITPTGDGSFENDYIITRHILTVNGQEFKLAIKTIDVGALNGVAGFAALCDAAGHTLKYKDNLTSKEKSDILVTFLKRAEDCYNYALGDLDVFEAAEKFGNKWKEVYTTLGLEDYFRLPALTTGSSVNMLFAGALSKALGLKTEEIKVDSKKTDNEEETEESKENKVKTNPWDKQFKEIVDSFIIEQSASELRHYTRNTMALLAKVEGGRCRNNRPTDVLVQRQLLKDYSLGESNTLSSGDVNNGVYIARKVGGCYEAFSISSSVDGIIVNDIDIKGCYGEGQRNQLYPIGNPEIYSFPVSSRKEKENLNKYVTLREWLEAYDVNINKLIEAKKKVKSNKSEIRLKGYEIWSNPKYWGELINGAWNLRFSTIEKLKYQQDFFASWFTTTGHKVDLLAKFVEKMGSDTEFQRTDWTDFNEEEGQLKIFNYEIFNAILTHDGLEWIFAIASENQRDEFLDNTKVLASTVYPRSEKIDCSTPEESLKKLKEVNENWDLQNTQTRVTRKRKNGTRVKRWRYEDGECHSWFCVNMGELLIDDLLIERQAAQILYGKKSPLDVLFKLCVNTLYGDMVSKFFTTANTVVGNCITARARTLCWCMEKGLYGWQSITDGCAFRLDQILFPLKGQIDGETINLHRKGSKLDTKEVRTGFLSDAKDIKAFHIFVNSWDKKKEKSKEIRFTGLQVINQENEEILIVPTFKEDKEHSGCFKLIKNNPADWIDEEAMKHLQNCFPLLSVLHSKTEKIKVSSPEGIDSPTREELIIKKIPRAGQYSFETKDLYFGAGFHGSANYAFVKGDLPNAQNGFKLSFKCRGYEMNREHQSFEVDELKLAMSDRYGEIGDNQYNTPANDFLTQIITNPTEIKRQKVAVKSGILKISDYSNNHKSYDQLGLEPGDNLLKPLLMTEFSLTQFTFQTYEQYTKWKKQIDKLKDEHCQSVEMFFLKENGTLDYPRMCQKIDELIVENPKTILKGLDKNMHSSRDLERDHPEKEALEAVKNKLNQL